MPPRSRTPSPARRPRVAGLRDPRRLQDPESTTDATTEATTEATEATEATTARPGGTEASASTPTRSSGRRASRRPAEPDTDPGTAGSAASEDAAPTGTGARGRGGTVTATSPVSLTKPVPAREDEGDGTAEAVPAASPTRAARPTPTGRARPTRRRPAPATGSAHAPKKADRTRRARRGAPRWLVPALAVAVVVLLVAAGLSFFFGYQAWSTPARSNTAVIDGAATAEVAGATRQAMEQVFSYDPAKLDDSVNAANDLGTGDFPRQYTEVFNRSTRPNAQQQGLKQTASVLDLGVRSIDGDDANVIVLVQFDVARASTGQTATTPGLLSAYMHRDGGRWKVARVVPLTGQG